MELTKHPATHSAPELRDIHDILSELSNRPATSSTDELRDIRKNVLRERYRSRRSNSVDNLRKMVESDCFYDKQGQKCSPKRKIGEGSSSHIYKFEYDKNKEEDDDKVIKLILKSDEENLKDLNEESNILKRTDSSQIIKYFGSIRNNPSDEIEYSKIGFMLEYCENGDLYQYMSAMSINKEKLDFDLMKQWCNECMRSVKYLHSKNIIHRDIKSLNFLITKDNHVKLSDFGKAREDTPYNRETTLKRLRSSPCWTAPELCNWDNDDNDDNDDDNLATYSSDVYALSIVLWEIIYYYYHNKYKRPYEGDMYKIYNQISLNKRPKIDKLFTYKCKKFLKRCWHNDPKIRPTVEKMNSYFNTRVF